MDGWMDSQFERFKNIRIEHAQDRCSKQKSLLDIKDKLLHFFIISDEEKEKKIIKFKNFLFF